MMKAIQPKMKGLMMLSRIFIFVFAFLHFPLASLAIEPVFRAEFNEAEFAQSGWQSMAAGFGQYQPASVSIGPIPGSPQNPDLSNGRGVIVTALSGQGAFVYGPTIQTDSRLMLLRVSVISISNGGSVAMGALDVAPNGTIGDVDGSLSYLFETNSNTFRNEYQQITMLYQPKSNAMIPFIQLAVESSDPPQSVTVMFDNFLVYPLDTNTVADPALQQVFGISEGVLQPTSTPTPTFTLPPEPTQTPTSTPTSTPTIPPGDTITGDVFSVSSIDDNQDAIDPSVAFDQNQTYSVVAADNMSGFQDIVLRNVNTEDLSISSPITVNETFEDTRTESPDVDIDFGGTRHIVWTDNRFELFSIYLAQYNFAGSRLVDADFEVNMLFENTNTEKPVVAAQDNGNLIVGWRDDRNFLWDFHVRRLYWDGGTLNLIDGEDFLVNIPREETDVDSLDIEVEPSGQIMAVWSDNRVELDGEPRNDIFGRLFTMNTAIDGGELPSSVTEIKISDYDNIRDDAFDPQVAYNDGWFLIVWRNLQFDNVNGNEQPSSHINAAVVDSNGNVRESEFVMDSNEAGLQNVAPSVAPWGEDSFVVSWYDEINEQTWAQWYNAREHMYLTDPIPLVQDVRSLNKKGIATDGENGFLSIWDSFVGGYHDIYGFAGWWLSENTMSKATPPAKSSGATFSISTAPANNKVFKALRQGRNTKPAREQGELKARR